MFSVLGADGTVYGPVDTATVRSWIAQGRVTPDTMLVDAVTDRQAPAKDILEFTDAFVPMPPGMNPGPPTAVGTQTSSGFGRTMGYGMTTSSYPAYDSRSIPQPSHRSKVVAILLAFFLGSLGIHRFYLGYTTIGIAMLLFSVLTCFIGTIITSIVALVDLIMIATGALRDAEGRELVS